MTEYGIVAQNLMMIEEMSELTKAICKHDRHPSFETIDNILEEMADVQIMLNQLETYYDFDNQLSKYKDKKLIRLKEKLNS